MSELAAPAWPFGPRQPLPVRVEPVPGESTGSFVSRLAHGQGLGLEELLERVGFGQASTDPVRVRAYPSTTEMYVNERGLEYLAVLADSTPRALQEVLPSTAAAHLLTAEQEDAVWTWPWQVREGHLVPLCGTCTAARGVRETVWMISPDRWRVCLEHLRFTDSDGTGGERGLSLKLLPETVAAHQEREALSRPYGAAGEELFADAFQITVHWWTHLPHTTRWVQRARDAGLRAHAVPTAPLVLMPEAAAVAGHLAAFEVSGQRDSKARARWLEELRDCMDRWGVDFTVGRWALTDWLQRHSAPAGPPGTDKPAMTTAPQARHVRSGPPSAEELRQVRLRLSAGHECAEQPTGVLGVASCLPWQLGDPACEM
ncbi:TniQ family protein [Streptomyces cavernicola]|uniref:TniQ family protein n=1 Tax=Streptomyces cavernicola TaxID=3043613 RepID=A0ABT6SMZ4_9ACTN|nr:TniQ family protein [Streptomyces sp. B-S-A6]MDI3409484.1 TniQ family protein [Streptomyces sp. B-S-A6]